MRILIVEDDARTAEYVRKGFVEAGHVADVLVDGRDALAHAMREPYDVLVVDRMLPGLDGLSLVKALRASVADVDPVRNVIKDLKTADLKTVDSAHAAMVTGLQDAWMNKGAA